ncbi:MAG: DUF3808 domain-containing protein [Bacteroidetes bacterium]|nr:DUF3808 domain-containing protein [Bacteroidota bacterium]
MKANIIILFLFSCSIIFGQEKLNSLLNKGREESYKFNLKKAEQIYESALSFYPQSPEPFYQLSRLSLWKYLGSRDQGQYKIFRKYAKHSMDRLEPLMDDDDENLELLLLMAKLNQDEATALAYNYEPTEAFWPARRSNSYFKDVLDIDPCNTDALLGSAIYNYSLSYVPGYLRWILNMTGLETDYVLALEKLKRAKLCSGDYFPELDFHLGIVYSEYVAEHDSALILFNRLTSKYPQNIIFRYQASQARIRSRRLDDALIDLERILSVKEVHFQQTKAFCYFHIAEIYFAKNNFQVALDYYKSFIKSTLDINFNGLSSLRMSICYFALGDEENYKKNLLETKLGNEELAEDKYAMELADGYLVNAFTKDDLIVWKLRNSLVAGEYGLILEQSKKMSRRKLTNKLRIKVDAILSEALIQTGDYKRAIPVLSDILRIKEIDKKDKMYSKWLLSQAYFEEGEMELAYQFAADFDELDYYSDYGLTNGEVFRFTNMLKNYKKQKNKLKVE